MVLIRNPYFKCNTVSYEDANHFFFICPKHDRHRFELTRQVGILCIEFSVELHLIHNTQVILFGYPDLNAICNKQLVSIILQYIEKTGRFES
jgi:hypothetical protein